MEIFRTRRELSEYLLVQNKLGKVCGLVPTMGALHDGHLSLIDVAGKESDYVVCSIFVNPTQFNDARDLEKYPRTIEQDIQKLNSVNCDVLFLPETSEIYLGVESWHIDLGTLDKSLEGELRPGHYQGVTQIVKKLFDIINPDKAYFGQKDYQQFLVISKMVKTFNLSVKLVMCPIVRETDGLAMSSRNIHLSPTDRQNALALHESLVITKQKFPHKSIEQLEEDAKQYLSTIPGLSLDYFSICHSETLQKAEAKDANGLVALVAAKVGCTRLIDNIILS
ncbi:MAG: pantoate--beta-alanine ligase [Sphingobacteriales bacterium]|nr:pantoate--beta-alanine ligase [Sphingobacteriales bacterium]